jgi:S-adenosylmethionine hydrolase
MAIVTLTTDLGARDFYLAALKGAIYTTCGLIPITDINNAVKLFDIKEAAYIIRNAYSYFPKGSIHIVYVNASDAKGKLLICQRDGHYFITFDNGLLSIAFGKTPAETYVINEELYEGHNLTFAQPIANIVNLLLKEYKPTDFAHLATDTVNYRLLNPIETPGSIRGTIMYIDNYGNAIVNITRDMFERVVQDKRFTILANIANTKTVSQHYSDVDEGDLVCLFNSAGYLEIAINKGKADSLLGLRLDGPVLVMLD